MTVLDFYRFTTARLEPALQAFLSLRLKSGKELGDRLEERKGVSNLKRPVGTLILLHAASVGEAQSALILIQSLLKKNDKIHVLITTGTVTSARMMEKNLPVRVFHQFFPLDHPVWVKRFLDHWKPDLVLWMESELWPNMLMEIRDRRIPAALVNARLSNKSFRRWEFLKSAAREILSIFDAVLAQTPKDAERFKSLGAGNVFMTDNLKYSARPLACDETELAILSSHIGNRPLWLFASTHKGEESMACRIHQRLKAGIPDILTIVVPRHPDRRDEIKEICEKEGISYCFRTKKDVPVNETGIYIADTMGELGLFYRLAPVACIGRSFSHDGGGGHNPIEAAQLNCAVLHGPHVQFQRAIYDAMDEAGAAIQAATEYILEQKLYRLLTDPPYLESCRKNAFNFLHGRETVVERVMDLLNPLLEKAVSS